jgi:SAM-dependent methyltransferase
MLARPDRSLSEDQWLERKRGRFVFSRLVADSGSRFSPVSGLKASGRPEAVRKLSFHFREEVTFLSAMEESQKAVAQPGKNSGKPQRTLFVYSRVTSLSDNSFDVVTLIAGLHFANRPQKVIAEAIRVCRGRLFIGFFNKNYIVGTKRSIGRLFGFASAEAIRFYTLYDVRSMVKRQMAVSSLRWGSVIYLPGPFYMFFSELEEIFPMYKNLGGLVEW